MADEAGRQTCNILSSEDPNGEGGDAITLITAKRRIQLFNPHVIALALCLFIIIFAAIIAQRLGDYHTYGYAGAFIISLAGNASIIFPVPAVAAAYALGGILNPFLIGILSGAGMTLGELTGYLAGYSGAGLARKSRFFLRMSGWMRRHGSVAIFLTALIPNPFFDVIGATAGALEYPLLRFMLFCGAGKMLKALALAFAGHWSLGYLLELYHHNSWFTWPF